VRMEVTVDDILAHRKERAKPCLQGSVPAGTSEYSPALQRWVRRPSCFPSPGGAADSAAIIGVGEARCRQSEPIAEARDSRTAKRGGRSPQ
jgi:hypothetical protein